MIEVAQSIMGAGEFLTEPRRPRRTCWRTWHRKQRYDCSKTDPSYGESGRPQASLLTSPGPQFAHLKNGKVKKFINFWDA